MLPYPFDHVAVAVTSLEEAAALLERVTGDRRSPPEEMNTQGVRLCFIGSVELLEPLHADTPVGRFLQRRGPGLHHIAYRVPDLADALARLKREGLSLIDEEPRPGAHGRRVAFLHPRSTGGILVELVQVSSD